MSQIWDRILSAAAVLAAMNAFSAPPAEAARGGRSLSSVDISRVPSAPPAPMSHAEFSHGGVKRPYALFMPPRTSSVPGPRPLLVLLHGCDQDAETFAKATRMNELAIRENAFALYPEQPAGANPRKCWNWSDPVNQERDGGAGERAWIAALIDSVAGALKADRARIFIVGFSAGGAMAVNMLSCHPDLFAAAGVFAGAPFAAAATPEESRKTMRSGTSVAPRDSAAKAFACAGGRTGKPLPIFVAHGDADGVIDKTNARQILKHFEALNDLHDDGKANGSFAYSTMGTKTSKARRGARAHSLEALLGPERSAAARLLRVKKLGHAWSGGDPSVPHSDGKGPAASDLMWDFFSSL